MNRKQWITDSFEYVYELTNLQLTPDGSPLRMPVPALSPKELSCMLSDEIPPEEALISYYRTNIMLYVGITYESKQHFKFKPDTKYDDILQMNDNMIGQPIHCDLDSQHIPQSDNYVDITIPTEWIAVIPPESGEVLDMLEGDTRDLCLKELIYNYLYKTLPITIHEHNEGMDTDMKEQDVNELMAEFDAREAEIQAYDDAQSVIARYAKDFLNNNREVMAAIDVAELERALAVVGKDTVDKEITNGDKCIEMSNWIKRCYDEVITDDMWQTFVDSTYTISFMGKTIRLENDADTYDLMKTFLEDLAKVND